MDQGLDSLRSLLTRAHQGGDARSEALAALGRRTVFVPIQNPDEEGLQVRVVRDELGRAGLPLFTEESLLRKAASRYGWFDQDGKVMQRELATLLALHHASAEGMHFIVVDVTEPYAVEFASYEWAQTPSKRDQPTLRSSRDRISIPPEAFGERIAAPDQTMTRPSRRSLRRSSMPTSEQSGAHPHPDSWPAGLDKEHTRPFALLREPGNEKERAAEMFLPSREAGGESERVELQSLLMPLPAEIMAALIAVLSRYPALQWAALCDTVDQGALIVAVASDSGSEVDRLALESTLAAAAGPYGQSLRCVLVEDEAQMAKVREFGLLFYPGPASA